MKVLLVDDDPEVLRGLGGLLTKRGYIVTKASSIGVSLTVIQSAKFDALVVDWYLDEGNAHDVLEAFRTAHPSSPRVVISGLEQSEVGYKGPLVDAWLVKPFTVHELVRSIGDLEASRATQADLSAVFAEVREEAGKKKNE